MHGTDIFRIVPCHAPHRTAREGLRVDVCHAWHISAQRQPRPSGGEKNESRLIPFRSPKNKLVLLFDN
jgi:hypothetical protein